MDMPTPWPASLRSHLLTRYGRPVAVDSLAGMSVARVYRVHFARASVIVKRSPRAGEWAFYTRVADLLRADGIPIPFIEFADSADGTCWLVMEDLPGEVTSEPPYDEIMAVLARMHRATRGVNFAMPPSPVSRWTTKMTAEAVSWFEPGLREAVALRLGEFERRATSVLHEWCWISGDPSLPNWGRRADGQLVLFDWELFRRGSPATDIAITVGGLPAWDELEAAAIRYSTAWSGDEPSPWTLAEFVRDMAVAKAGTVVTLLAAQTRGEANVPPGYVHQLLGRLPGWLEMLAES